MKKKITFLLLCVPVYVLASHFDGDPDLNPVDSPRRSEAPKRGSSPRIPKSRTRSVSLSPDDASWINNLHIDGKISLLKTPDDLDNDFIQGINSAQDSIFLVMYHLTDPKVIDALISKKKSNPNFKMTIILDRATLEHDAPPPKGLYTSAEKQLKDAGIDVERSDPQFSITHAKAMLIDKGKPQQRAFITAINLTTHYMNTRDFGIVTTDQGIINEMSTVFSNDLSNVQHGTENKAQTSNPNLIWSPLTSKDKILDVINHATKTLRVEVENIVDKDIMAALNNKALQGVKVKLMAPLCDKNVNPLLNYDNLPNMPNVQVRMMHVLKDPKDPGKEPYTALHPYMHSKMIPADQGESGQMAYIGSINFSTNSLQKARELGVVVAGEDDNKKAVLADIAKTYDTDWGNAEAPPATRPDPNDCPAPN